VPLGLRLCDKLWFKLLMSLPFAVSIIVGEVYVIFLSFQDEKFLIWYSGEKENQLRLSSITNVIRGQSTVSSEATFHINIHDIFSRYILKRRDFLWFDKNVLFFNEGNSSAWNGKSMHITYIWKWRAHSWSGKLSISPNLIEGCCTTVQSCMICISVYPFVIICYFSSFYNLFSDLQG